MITVSFPTVVVLREGSFRYAVRVQVLRGGEILADDVPIISGVEEFDASSAVPERVTITVPRVVDGRDWAPVDAFSALAPYGQRLRVQLGVGMLGQQLEWFDRGEFLIIKTAADQERVTVDAAGLLYLINEARLVSPYQPSGTFVSTVRGLLEPALTVIIDSALPDRAVPASINFDEDRLQALQELLDAWPAVAQMGADGALRVMVPRSVTQSTFADWDLYDYVVPDQSDVRPTVITTTGDGDRDGVFNAVVVRGTAPDGGQLQGVAYDTGPGAASYGGPFNPLPVPYYFSSPLLSTQDQCAAAAKTVLARIRRTTYGTTEVRTVPVPVLQGGDVVRLANAVTGADPRVRVMVVDGYTLPYTADDGPMVLQLRQALP